MKIFSALRIYLLIPFLWGMIFVVEAADLEDSSGAEPPFNTICTAQGYPDTSWGHTLCMEGHRRAWRADPQAWRKDQSRPPDLPRVEVYRAEKIPFASDLENISLPPPPQYPLDPWSGN